MNIYEAFETDSSAIEEGRWLEIVFQGEVTCKVRVRSASPDLNPNLRKAMTDEAIGLLGKDNDLQRTVASALRDPDLERRLFAHAVVSEWDGVKDRRNRAIKFTPAAAEKVFKDLPLLFQQVKSAAYRWETFRKVVTDAAVGNS